MMRPDEFRKPLKAEPFEPVNVGLADGRCVQVRHPDQAVVADRHLLVGLAKLERSKPLATPKSGDAIAKDWLIINLLQVTTVEPAGNGNGRSRTPRKRRA
jgi:hypothetical protein